MTARAIAVAAAIAAAILLAPEAVDTLRPPQRQWNARYLEPLANFTSSNPLRWRRLAVTLSR